MSETAKKLKIEIEGGGVSPAAAQMQAAEKEARTAPTVSAADMAGGPMPAEETERRKGLPAEGEAWTHKHDMVVMGRLGRAVEGVPAAALRRILPWFEGVTREVMYPAAERGDLAKTDVPSDVIGGLTGAKQRGW